jgi:protein phosphatase 1L
MPLNLMQRFSGSRAATMEGAATRGAPSKAEGKTSGGETREDGRVSFGYSTLRGKRASMEDFLQAKFSQHPTNGSTVGFFGVFDGHGGPGAAAYVQENLWKTLQSHDKFDADIKQALVEAFVETDKAYLADEANSKKDDGCTAVAAVLLEDRLIVANVGDSRAVLSRGGKAYPMSEDHKPNRADERQRIEEAGGVVVWAGTWRVGGVLAVSRAFGDRLLKKYVVAEPDVLEESLTGDDTLLIMATDGLWDVVSNQDAISMVRNMPTAEAAAVRLTNEAFQRGSNDNISCIVVAFKFNQAEATGGDPITAAAGDSGTASTHAAPELQRVPAAAADHATNAQA